MSFLLMNLFSAPAPAATLSGQGAAKAAPAGGQNPAGGQAFSAVLAEAKLRVSGAQDVAKPVMGAANVAALQALMAQPIKNPEDMALALKDLTLTKEQLNDAVLAMRQALDAGDFSGDTGTQQAFEQMQEQLKQEAEMLDVTGAEATDVVDIEPVMLQLPAVAMAPEGKPRSEMIARLVQFLQSTARLNGHAANGGDNNQANQLNKKAAQTSRLDPMLGVVQASMFLATAQGAAAQASETQTLTQDMAAPTWLRGVSASEAAPAQVELPEIALPEVALSLPAETPHVSKVAPQAPLTKNTADLGEASIVAMLDGLGSEVAAPQLAPLPDSGAVAVPDSMQAVDADTARAVSLMMAGAGVIVKPENAEAADAPVELIPSRLTQAANVDAEHQPSVANNAGQVAAKQTPATIAASAEKLPPASLPKEFSAALDAVNARADGDALSTSIHSISHAEKPAAIAAAKPIDTSLFTHRAQVIEQVHVAIARANNAEIERITIQLDPADLGRVDVTMDVRRDGTTQLLIAADRRETLDMLQRDARGLERLLQESGVKADAGSMEFNLRQNPQQAALMQQDQDSSGHSRGGDLAAERDAADKRAASAELLPDSQLIAHATINVASGVNVIA